MFWLPEGEDSKRRRLRGGRSKNIRRNVQRNENWCALKPLSGCCFIKRIEAAKVFCLLVIFALSALAPFFLCVSPPDSEGFLLITLAQKILRLAAFSPVNYFQTYPMLRLALIAMWDLTARAEAITARRSVMKKDASMLSISRREVAVKKRIVGSLIIGQLNKWHNTQLLICGDLRHPRPPDTYQLTPWRSLKIHCRPTHEGSPFASSLGLF